MSGLKNMFHEEAMCSDLSFTILKALTTETLYFVPKPDKLLAKT